MKKFLYLLGIFFITSTCSPDSIVVDNPKEIITEIVYDTIPVYDTVVVKQYIPTYYKVPVKEKQIVYDTVVTYIYEYIPEIIYEYTQVTITDTILTEVNTCSKQGFICKLICGKK